MHGRLLFSQTMSSRQLPPVGRPLEEYVGYPDLASFPPPDFSNKPIQLGFVPYQHAQGTMHRTSVQQQPLPYRVHPQYSQQVSSTTATNIWNAATPFIVPHSQRPVQFRRRSSSCTIRPSAILASQLGCLQCTSRKLWVKWLHSFRTPYKSSAAHNVPMLHQ